MNDIKIFWIMLPECGEYYQKANKIRFF